MSSIFGVYYRYQFIPTDLTAKITHALNYWNADKLGYWSDKHIGLGSLLLINTPEAIAEIQPLHVNPCVTVADSRLDNRDKLCEILKLGASATDSEIITHAYLTWHENCTKHLLGDFAFAIWNKQTNSLFCARDHMGVKPLYYINNEVLFAFSSDLKAFLNIPDIKIAFDDIQVSRFLTMDVLMTGEYTENTLYKNIRRLTPAHQIHADHRGFSKKHYWDLNQKKEIHYKNEVDYVEHYQYLLDQSVKARLRSEKAITCELSGGIDSSSVTAYAVKNKPDIIAITHKAPPNTAYLDETDLAKKLCDYCHIQKHIIVDAQDYDLILASKQAIQTSSMPLQVTHPILAYNVMKAAQQLGAGVILSGFGGDECATGHAGLLMEELALQKNWKMLWKELKAKAKLSNSPYLKSFIAAYIKHQYPSLYSVIKKNPVLRKISIDQLIINKKFIAALNFPEYFDEFKSFYHCSSTRDSEYNLLAGKYSWHLRARLENSNVYAKGFQLEYRYPMLDIRLLEFCLNVPSYLKRKNGWGRYLARQGLQNLIPPALQWRQDKAGSPVPAALHRIKEQGQLVESLETTPLNDVSEWYFGQFKKELLQHPDTLISLYAVRSGMNLLQFQLLQNELEKITA